MKVGAAPWRVLLSRELSLCLAGLRIPAWRNCGDTMLQMVYYFSCSIRTNFKQTKIIHSTMNLCGIKYNILPMLVSVYSSLVYPPIRLLSVCHRGYFNCSYSPCPAVCTVYSDRHYHTFDGLEYDYHSDCQVYLLKVSKTSVCVNLTFLCAQGLGCKMT